MAARQPRFNKQVLIDTTPLPDDIPKVPEIGASSAPLLSASFFIGARCRAYNDDYMVCKTEANGRGELECMKEGRKVSRCAASVYVCLATLRRQPLASRKRIGGLLQREKGRGVAERGDP
ncbi:ndufa8, NADH-ubiquinone oxidoreductase complex I 19kd subunit [Elasticomyces elasticus]|nr:ndufa8, NADH-ubiquinone oxidoreductase complex I 19kd subunit [Elasticomyces elasticus]